MITDQNTNSYSSRCGKAAVNQWQVRQTEVAIHIAIDTLVSTVELLVCQTEVILSIMVSVNSRN